MKTRWILLLCIGWIWPQEREVKFYNLEKEYSKTITYVYPVKQAKALELKHIVQNMLSIFGSLYVNETSNALYITDVEDKINDLKAVLPGLDVAGITAGDNLISRLFKLKHEHAAEVLPLVRHKLSGDGNVYEVPTLNAIIISDVESKIEEVLELLAKVDVPTPLVSIEITVIEFNNEYFSKIGVNIFDWLQNLSVGANVFSTGGGELRTNLNINSKQSGPEPDLAPHLIDPVDLTRPIHIKAGVNVSDIVNFINENADGSVLANTRLVTRNNKQAYLDATEIVPFRMYENEVMDQSPVQNIALTGTAIRVTPTLQEDNLINLRIDPSISDLTGWSPKGMPIVFRRALSTEVKVGQNQVFALGGLTRTEKSKIRRGIPILKDIPILGFFFSTKEEIILQREVMMFITPSLINSQEISGPYNNMKKRWEEGK